MSAATENALARQIASANSLLARSVIDLRDLALSGVEGGSELVQVGDDLIPERSLITRLAIIHNLHHLALIREIEAHLGFAPSPGPAWFDEIVLQGPDWAGPAS